MDSQYTCMGAACLEHRADTCQQAAAAKWNNYVIELNYGLFQYLGCQAALTLYDVSMRKRRYKSACLLSCLLPGDLASLEKVFSRSLDMRTAINQPSQFQL